MPSPSRVGTATCRWSRRTGASGRYWGWPARFNSARGAPTGSSSDCGAPPSPRRRAAALYPGLTSTGTPRPALQQFACAHVQCCTTPPRRCSKVAPLRRRAPAGMARAGGGCAAAAAAPGEGQGAAGAGASSHTTAAESLVSSEPGCSSGRSPAPCGAICQWAANARACKTVNSAGREAVKEMSSRRPMRGVGTFMPPPPPPPRRWAPSAGCPAR